MRLFKKTLSTKDKPKVISVNNQWQCHFRNLWYGGDSPINAYNNCKKFHFPREL